jgi:hypothetical protein
MAHIVGQNFSGSAGQSVEAVLPQHKQVVSQGQVREFDTINDLHR